MISIRVQKGDEIVAHVCSTKKWELKADDQRVSLWDGEDLTDIYLNGNSVRIVSNG